MKHFLASLYILFSLGLFAQQPLWKRFSPGNGLPTTITTFAQTTDGILWIGTQEGLIRYDGIKFEYAGGSSSEKPYVQGIITDKQQNLFLATRSGLWRYNTTTDHLIKLRHPGIDISIRNIVWNNDSTRIIASSDNGVLMYKPDELDLIPEQSINRRLHIGHVYHLNGQIFATSGNSVFLIDAQFKPTYEIALTHHVHDLIWYAPLQKYIALTIDGLFAYNTQNRSFDPVGPGFPQLGLSHSQCLFTDSKNRIWINTNDTIYCYPTLAKNSIPDKCYWEKDNPASILPTPICFFEDQQHNIWIGAGGSGLAVHYNQLDDIRYLHPSAYGTNIIWSTYHDTTEGVLLYGTNNSIVIRDTKTPGNQFKIISKPKTNERFTVTCFTNFSNEQWWVGTYGGGLWLLHKKTHKLIPFGNYSNWGYNTFYYLPDGSLLLLGVGFVHRYSQKEGMQHSWGNLVSGNNITIKAGRDNEYWIGTSNGVLKVDAGGHLVKRFVPQGVNPDANSDFPVMALYYHSETGDLYAATMGWGLCVIRKGTDMIEPISLTHKPGMAFGILPYFKNELLLTTGNGLYLYDLKSGSCKIANMQNGLPFNEFDQFGYYYSDHQYTLMGSGGYLTFPEKAVKQLFNSEPAFRLFQNNIASTEINLQDSVRSMNLTLSPGIDASVQSIKYTYRINELDQTFHVSDGKIEYNYIPAGNYTLTIQAEDINNRFEPETITIPVTVQPRWYETIWFRITAGVLALLILIYLVRYFSYLRLQWNLRKLEARQKVAEERLRISRELHDNVGSQLTYLITGLEASEILLKQQHAEKLSVNLEQLQHSARDSMQQLRDAIWALNKEEMTLVLLADRFKYWTAKMMENTATEVRFEFTITHNHNLDALNTLNIFRILQEAIHNIIKHANATKVDISITTTAFASGFVITDNGDGLTAKTEGYGIQNMKARASEMGAVLSISNAPFKGTTVQLQCFVK